MTISVSPVTDRISRPPDGATWRPAIVVLDAMARSIWDDALTNTARVTVSADPASVIAAVRGRSADAVMIAIRGAEQGSVVRAIGAVRAAHAAVPILGYVPRAAGPGVLMLLPVLMQAGLTKLVIDGQDDLEFAVMDVVRRTPHGRTPIEFDTEIARIPSRVVRNFCHACFTNDARAGVLSAVANQCGSTARHVARELAILSMMSPRALLLAIRLYRTWCALVRDQQPRDEVCRAFHWGSEDALRKGVARSIGISLSVFTTPDAEAALVQYVRALLRPGVLIRR